MKTLPSLLLCAAVLVAPAFAGEPVTFYDYEVVRTYPHDEGSFTQGLFFHDGALFETTGQYARSRLRLVDLESGAPLREQALPDDVFGEGSVLVDGEIFVLSWKRGQAFRYGAQDFELRSVYDYDGEGWGLTYDGETLIMSDGTAELRFIDPTDFTEKRRVRVTYRGKPLRALNELEWIDGSIYANVWQSDVIVQINPSNGEVIGVINLNGLLMPEDITQGQTDVLNGIAYNPQTKKIYVTGKNWPKLFEIKLSPKAPKN